MSTPATFARSHSDDVATARPRPAGPGSLNERDDREDERERDRGRADPAGDACGGQTRAAERDDERAGERQARGRARRRRSSGSSRAAPAARRRRSAAGGGRARRSCPRPIDDLAGGDDHDDDREDLAVAVAPHAAKAISARLPAFSISSRQSRITSGLRRTSTPTAPSANMSAETTRYQEMFIDGSSSAARGCPRSARASARDAVAGDALGHRAGGGRHRPRRGRGRGRSSGPARRLVLGMPPRRPASTTAPTAATSSRNEATSNGSRKRVSSSSPICAGRAEADASTFGARRCRAPSSAGAEHARSHSSTKSARPNSDRQRRAGRALGAPERLGSSPPPT